MKAGKWIKTLGGCALALIFLLGSGAPASATSIPWAIFGTPTGKPWELPLPTPRPTPAPSPEIMDDETPLPTDTPQPEETLAIPTQEEGVLSLLLIGVDAHGSDNHGRSDTMILARLNTNTGEIKLVSFLRDLYVKIPGKGKTRLNAAYYYGGAELLKKTLSSNFAVNVDGAVAVDFRSMVAVIDQIGGVPVTFNEKERLALNKLLKEYNRDYGFDRNDGLVEKAGEQVLTGKQALCFSRIRKLDSDFVRTDRQRRVLEGMLSKIRTLSLPKLLGVAAKVWGSLETDLKLSDAMALLPLLRSDKELTLSGMQIPTDNGYQNDVINGMMVLVPNLKKNTQAIRNFFQ
ncbi:MAG: LCP family protein [Clostridiales bacterium]|nr:LCP family protein [Clostridiales bacterium]